MKTMPPRVLGLVVPPLGVTFQFDENAVLLEKLLSSTFYGVPSESRLQLQAELNTPDELVVFYDPLITMKHTNLYKILHRFDPEELIFGNYFKNARHAWVSSGFTANIQKGYYYRLRDVGSCASDLVWRRALKDLEYTVQPVFEEYDDEMNADTRSRKVRYDVYSTLKDWSFTMPNFDPESKGFNVVPKFAKLVEILKACQPDGDAFRGVLFGMCCSARYRSIFHRLFNQYIGVQ
jgi:endoribonuclease Dicer